MTNRTTLLGTVAIATLAAGPLIAQSSDGAATQGDQMQSDQMQEMQFSEGELESFVEAAMKVIALREAYQEQIEAAADRTEAQALVQQAQQEMVTAIEETDGITVEAYNEIGQAAQQSPELNQRVIALIQERNTAEGG